VASQSSLWLQRTRRMARWISAAMKASTNNLL
jgi:hypothetical protein